MKVNSSRLLALAGLTCAAAMAASPVSAQTGADFYKGKTVTYIASTSPGGGYDLYGRLVAEFMQKHLPGSTFVIKNVPGAGHLVGANTIYASKPDGLTIGIFNTGLIYNQVLGAPGVKFDLGKMSWVGKAASDPRVITIATQSPIKSFKDLQASKETVNFAVGGIGSATISSRHADQRAEAAGQGAHRLQRRRRPDGGAPRDHRSVASRSSWEQFVKNGTANSSSRSAAARPIPRSPLWSRPDRRAVVARSSRRATSAASPRPSPASRGRIGWTCAARRLQGRDGRQGTARQGRRAVVVPIVRCTATCSTA